jgi:hypothetical protein
MFQVYPVGVKGQRLLLARFYAQPASLSIPARQDLPEARRDAEEVGS